LVLTLGYFSHVWLSRYDGNDDKLKGLKIIQVHRLKLIFQLFWVAKAFVNVAYLIPAH